MTQRRFAGDERATTAVEFALTAPLFVLIFGGVVATGFLMWTQVSLQRAVESAARCASVNQVLCGNEEAVRQFAASRVGGLAIPPSSFQVSQQSCGVEVSGSYTVASFATAGPLASVSINVRYCYPK
jgi:Flp pilus assembly protein TadG